VDCLRIGYLVKRVRFQAVVVRPFFHAEHPKRIQERGKKSSVAEGQSEESDLNFPSNFKFSMKPSMKGTIMFDGVCKIASAVFVSLTKQAKHPLRLSIPRKTTPLPHYIFSLTSLPYRHRIYAFSFPIKKTGM
jgi:hypothetical protein